MQSDKEAKVCNTVIDKRDGVGCGQTPKVLSAEVIRSVYLIEKVHQHWRKVGVLQRKVQARHNQKDERHKDRALVVVRAWRLDKSRIVMS